MINEVLACSVEYIDHMGTDLSVVNAARQSHDVLRTMFDETKDASLIDFLATGMRAKEWGEFLSHVIEIAQDAAKTGDPSHLKEVLLEYKRLPQHWAPFAHPHVTIQVDMPIFLGRQFVKHQVGGVWSELSRRYVAGNVAYFFEMFLKGRPSDIKQGSGEPVLEPMQGMAQQIMRNVSTTADAAYNDLIKWGVAPEEAREILTLNMMTTVTWTGSLAFWARVVNQRVDSHAQSAAQALGWEISKVIGPLFPVSWKALTGKDAS